MTPSALDTDPYGAPRPRPSRRQLIKGAAALGLSLAHGLGGKDVEARTAPDVTVAAPAIERLSVCIARVTVPLTLSGTTPGVWYEVSGDILESDDPDGDSNYCGALMPQAIFSPAPGRSSALVQGFLMVTELGLVKGVGPARDETTSPDQIELYARIWLRERATGLTFGPWLSPHRDAAIGDLLDEGQARTLPGSELMDPRRVTVAGAPPGATRRLPPLACFS